MANENIPISAQELLSKNHVILDREAKDFSTTGFWYYTSENTLDSILTSGKIWVSNFSEMNDLNEAKLHEHEKERIHALCFCNSDSEKIPMWYLYAGICGQGMRMGLTPSTMRSYIQTLLNNETIVYPVTNNIESEDGILLSECFEISYGWIYYRKNNTQIKHRGHWYSLQDCDLFEDRNYFIKDYPWEYEKEFRIVFKNISQHTYERISVPLPEAILKKVKISCAPEMVSEMDFLSKPGFAKYLESKIIPSKLSIRMDLIRRNKKDIICYPDQFIDQDNFASICTYARNKQYCSKKESE